MLSEFPTWRILRVAPRLLAVMGWFAAAASFAAGIVRAGSCCLLDRGEDVHGMPPQTGRGRRSSRTGAGADAAAQRWWRTLPDDASTARETSMS